MSSIKKISGVVLVGAALALAGCGNSDSTTTGGLGGGTTGGGGTAGGGTGTTTTGSTDNTAHTIALTYAEVDGIEVLGVGVYSLKGKAIVTDNEGNPVPDGTKVFLNVIDSVVAKGTLGASDSATGVALTDANPKLGDGVTDTTFDTAWIYRNDAYHFIEPNDHVFLLNANEKDKNRIVSSATGAIAANSLAVTSSYVKSYPDSKFYPAGTTNYVVGVSSLGAMVWGTDQDGNVTTEGYSLTKNGIAEFKVTYPANESTILTGCVPSVLDDRVLPKGSAKGYLVASAGQNAITLDERFCFQAVAGGTLTISPKDPVVTKIPGPTSVTVSYGLVLEDGGDKVNLPYQRVDYRVEETTNKGGLKVVLDQPFYITDKFGGITTSITVTDGAADDAAKVTYYYGEYEATAAVKILEGQSVTNALSIFPLAPVISKVAGATTKNSSVSLTLNDAAGNASKTVYARITETANTGGLTVTLDGAYNAVLDLYTYTTDSNGQFTSQITVSNGAASDAAGITYYYGALEAKATVSILP